MKGKFLGYRSQNKYRLHFSTLYPQLLPVIGNLLYLVCPLQSKHNRVHYKKEAWGFCSDVNDTLHAKTVSSLLDTLFVLKTYAPPQKGAPRTPSAFLEVSKWPERMESTPSYMFPEVSSAQWQNLLH